MADDTEDIFKPKLGRIRSLGDGRTKSCIGRVMHQVSMSGNPPSSEMYLLRSPDVADS